MYCRTGLCNKTTLLDAHYHHQQAMSEGLIPTHVVENFKFLSHRIIKSLNNNINNLRQYLHNSAQIGLDVAFVVYFLIISQCLRQF